MKSGCHIHAVVPVKGFDAAKSRLAPTYPPEFRRGLAQAMLEDVLVALCAATELAGLIVVTVDPLARAVAAHFGARIFDDGARDGHTGAVMAAARRLATEGRTGMLTVPGDIPLITSDEVSRLLNAHGEGPAFSIVPAHDGRGSNAILMTPPDAVPLAFGDDSFLPHLDTARRRGIEPVIVPMAGIGLDIDSGPDLALFMQTPSSTHSWAFIAAQGLVAPFRSNPIGSAAD
jgi:2-phospho-L-lactate guanylyltransferase